jgi:superfamily II DNA or RNA helicase
VRFARCWTAPPAIVAEALIGVPDVLVTALRPGAPAPGAIVASSLARSLSPPEHPARPPSWLFPEQVPSFRRALAALRCYRGALLADPVGSGKTFVALAVASVMNRGATTCLVPATLLGQWQATAERLSVPVTLCSHEQISRGRLPKTTRGLTVIDESHHFRNPHTRRYRHLAPWLVGRSTLLVTATPIVNRLTDLAHQLLLTIRDDALAPDGVPSLRAMLAAGPPSPALGRIVHERVAATDQRPRRVHRQSGPGSPEHARATRTIAGLRRLRLSCSPPIAELIRGVLLRAAASSPEALAGALRRYRKLLLHARDALQAGHPLDRRVLRHFTGELDDQLVWWELLPVPASQTDLQLSDLAELDRLVLQADTAGRRTDGKLDRLRLLLTDGIPTLVFTASRDTVRYIRRRLADLRLAWCTGEGAGIGNARLPRGTVLSWFREATDSNLAPRHLVVTDVAAEGLDLQRAARVIHYDLPWTPVRIEQREGRSVRYGSQHAVVEVVQFGLPPVIERQIRIESSLARKVKLPASCGLGPGGQHVWRWRVELAEHFREYSAQPGVASVPSLHVGLLAGFALYVPGKTGPVGTSVLWIEADGSWTEGPDIITPRLEAAAAQHETIQLDDARLNEWLLLLARPLRERLAFTKSRRWIMPEPTPAARQVMGRLQLLVREAARRHQARRLGELERTLAFVAGGHTAGEEALLDQLLGAPDEVLIRVIGTLPATRLEWEGLEARLTGLIVFGPAQASRTKLASGECPGFKPHSSISMEP